MSPERTKQEEVDLNFAFFQRELPRLLVEHRGKYALLKNREIAGFYDTAQDAFTAGRSFTKMAYSQSSG